jgi:competence protein ComEC
MSFLLVAVSGFATGVFLRSLFFTSWWPVVFVVFIAALCGAFYFLRPRLAYTMGAVFCLCVALGMVRAAIAETPLPTTFASDLHHKVSYAGVVVSDPDVRDANQRIQIEVERAGETTHILAVAPRTTEVTVGDRVNVSGVLLTPEPFADDNGRIFRYDKYLERDGVRFIMNFAFVRVESSAPWYSLPAALARVKHSFLNGIAATLPEPHASLAGGIVIGGKSGLGTELKNDFVRSGLVQIIVLSGYNVMVVAEMIMAALALTTLPRRWSAAAGALALLIFVGIAGASATAIRAALMALIALYARATGRTYAAGRALLFVVLLMLVWNPLYLVFDPGFGLSVVATAGLIWLAPIIETILRNRANGRNIFESYLPSATFPSGKVERSQKNSSMSDFWKNAVATTLAAQIAVLPLLLYDTGNLSFVSVPANLLIMPFVPLAMLFSAIAGFAGMLFSSLIPLLGIVIAFPAYLANAFLLLVAHESAALPLAAFTLPPFPFWLVLVAYGVLIYFASSKRFSTTLQLRFAKKASI